MGDFEADNSNTSTMKIEHSVVTVGHVLIVASQTFLTFSTPEWGLCVSVAGIVERPVTVFEVLRYKYT